jgi:peptidoglycan/LPS O-acetylase OafA/YrhL
VSLSPASAFSSRQWSLDLARGVSALLVMLGHLRLVVWPDFDRLQHASLMLKAAYFLTGFGNQAVLIFFVLSGYLVGGGVLAARGNPSPKHYAIARLSRLWVVLLPALLFTLAVDEWIVRAAPDVLASARLSHFSHDGGVYVLNRDWSVLLGNLFFVQMVWVPVLGSNGPLWSLACEAWYYVAFPMLVWGACGGGSRWKRLGWSLLFVALLCLMPEKMRSLFPAWLMGAAVHLLPASWSFLKQRWGLVLAFGVFMAAMVLNRIDVIPQLFSRQNDLILAFFCAAWCAHIHRGQTLAWPSVTIKPVIWLSDMSFTLYLFHMPMVFLVAAWLHQGRGVSDPTQASWALLAATACAIFLVALLFWALFERHATRVRRWLMLHL